MAMMAEKGVPEEVSEREVILATGAVAESPPGADNVGLPVAQLVLEEEPVVDTRLAVREVEAALNFYQALSLLSHAQLVTLVAETKATIWCVNLAEANLWGTVDNDGGDYCAEVHYLGTDPAGSTERAGWLGRTLLTARSENDKPLRALVHTTTLLNEFTDRLFVPSLDTSFPTLASVATELGRALAVGIHLEDMYAEHYPPVNPVEVWQRVDPAGEASLYLRLLRPSHSALQASRGEDNTKRVAQGSLCNSTDIVAFIKCMHDNQLEFAEELVKSEKNYTVFQVVVSETASPDTQTHVGTVYFLCKHVQGEWLAVIQDVATFGHRERGLDLCVARELASVISGLAWRTARVRVDVDLLDVAARDPAACQDITTWARAGFGGVEIKRTKEVARVVLTMSREDGGA